MVHQVNTKDVRYRNHRGQIVEVHEFRFRGWGASQLMHGQPMLLTFFTLQDTRQLAEQRLAEYATLEGWEKL